MKNYIYSFTVIILLILFLSAKIFSKNEILHSGKASTGFPFLLHNNNNVNQLPIKYPGFIGLYLNADQDIYGGWGWKSNQLLQTAFEFGINAVICQASYLGYTFKESIDSNCTVWNSNKIYGLLRPPSGQGALNQPDDTSLFYPYNYNAYPGMIQAAHRFSQLSKIYPQIQGIIIDDFFINYPDSISYNDLQEIKDALLGKTVEPNGLVDHNSKATTPNLKLYVVLYDQQINAKELSNEQSISNLIDGVNLWMGDQNTNYTNLDSYINDIHSNLYPGKKIILGIYVSKWASPDGIKYMLQRSFDQYDKGKISGVLLFAGVWLTEPNITQARWDSLAIPPLLDSLYYPYLGEGTGKVLDTGGNPIAGARVTIERIINGDTIIAAEKYTDSNGNYTFAGWAGKDSAVNYEVNVHAALYSPVGIVAQLQDQKDIALPVITLQTVSAADAEKDNVPANYSLSQNYPDPFNPSTAISYQLSAFSHVTLAVYDLFGSEVAELVNEDQQAGTYKVEFDASKLSSGVYFYQLKAVPQNGESAGEFIETKKLLLLK